MTNRPTVAKSTKRAAPPGAMPDGAGNAEQTWGNGGPSTSIVSEPALIVKGAGDNLTQALKYHSLGWSIFPLKPGSKKPHPQLLPRKKDYPELFPDLSAEEADKPTWKPYQVEQVSEDQVGKWWSDDPGAGIAVVLGKVSGGLVVFDFDGDGADQLAKDNGLYLPPTAISKTGGGGHHFLYYSPDRLATTTALLQGDGCHIELRAEGSYIVLPPSIHPTGTAYEWATPPEEITDLPGHICKAVLEAGSSHQGSAAPVPEKITEGQRNIQLTSLAGSLRRRGLPQATITQALLAVNAEQCDPPLPPEEVTSIGQSVSRYRPGQAVEEIAEVVTQKKAPRSKASVRALCQDGENKTIICPRLAEYLHSQAPVFSLAGTLYRYREGVYRPDGETSIRRDVSNILSEAFTGHRANEVVAYLQDKYSVSADDIDADAKILNVANGLLNVDTLELKPHDPQYPSITQVPVEFHSTAQCPAIDKFFSEVFPPDCIGLAYELTGYCLRRDLEPRTASLLLGPTHAGKSTFLSLLTSAVGLLNVVNIELQDFAEDRFATAQLFGKMLNTFADIPSRPLKSSSTFKALTGGDRISAQEKYGRRYDFKPTTKLIFSANQPPGTRDYSDAYYVRWCVVPFNNQFLGTAEDTDLLAKLTTKKELEGLLVAALRAAQTIPATGRLSEPGSVQRAKTMFREATDIVATFVHDVCEIDPDKQVGRDRLWQAYYKPWCENNNFRSLSQRTFNERLEEVVPGIHRVTPRDASGKQVKSWSGIGLSDKNNDWPEGAKTDLFE